MINTINIVPRYAETDKMGIVHHSVYAIWYELARTEYFNKIVKLCKDNDIELIKV